jgi:hypothetical protein
MMWKKEAACGRFGVDSVSNALEMNLLAFQVANQVDQAFDAPSEPVQFPDDQRIPLTKVGDCFFKARAIGVLSAEFIGEDAFAPGTVERVELQFQVLIGIARPGERSASKEVAELGSHTREQSHTLRLISEIILIRVIILFIACKPRLLYKCLWRLRFYLLASARSYGTRVGLFR